MATENKKFKLYRELRRKYWKKSDVMLVGWYLINDINKYKKYWCLTLSEMAELFKVTVEELEGEGTSEFYREETETGDLREFFLAKEDIKLNELFS